MSAARLAAEAAFAEPAIFLERRPAPPVVIEVRPRRSVTAPAGDERHAEAEHAPLPPVDRSPRVFRMDPSLRQAVGLPNADAGVGASAGSDAAAPVSLRRKRQAAPPVHIVHAAPAVVPVRAQAQTDARWADIARALETLEATLSAIQSAQAFATFAETHLPADADADADADAAGTAATRPERQTGGMPA